MSLDSWLHLVHVLSAMVWVGGGLMLSLIGARARSMVTEANVNNPSSRPHCRAMSRALNATARTPGKYRCRSCQRAARA